MSLPKVTLLYSNGNLLQDIPAIDGIGGIVATAAAVGNIGVARIVYNLDDAILKGYTEADEPFLYKILKEFYQEVAGNQKLYVMGVPDTMTMTQMLDNTNANGAKKLTNFANGEIRLLVVARKPVFGYDPGTNFFDADVSTAVTAAQTFGQARLAELIPLRILIEGRVVAENSGTVYQPKTANVDYAGVVVGSALNDGSASVGIALGRAVKYGAEIKIGKVANGPLSITDVYIGTKKIKDVPALETLNDNGCIVFMSYPNKAGFYFGIDRMANQKDYRLLAYGRVIDKAAIIAAATYQEELESEVNVDADGNISELDLQHLKGGLEQQINVAMADQISGVEIYINPNQNIINTSKLTIKLSIRPKGYTSFIDVDLGLVAPTA